MFRMWGKIWKDNHLVKDTVICQTDYSMSRTSMVFQSLDDICYEFDLGKPIWLSSNINDFKRHAKTRFTKDSFIEQIDFDYLEIEVIEEQKGKKGDASVKWKRLSFFVRWMDCRRPHIAQMTASQSDSGTFSGQILLQNISDQLYLLRF